MRTALYQLLINYDKELKFKHICNTNDCSVLKSKPLRDSDQARLEEIMDYLKKNDLIVGKPAEDFNFNDQQMKALKDAFASGDPDDPIVKRVRGALADLADDDDLVEVTPEMIYGKSN